MKQWDSLEHVQSASLFLTHNDNAFDDCTLIYKKNKRTYADPCSHCNYEKFELSMKTTHSKRSVQVFSESQDKY